MQAVQQAPKALDGHGVSRPPSPPLQQQPSSGPQPLDTMSLVSHSSLAVPSTSSTAEAVNVTGPDSIPPPSEAFLLPDTCTFVRDSESASILGLLVTPTKHYQAIITTMRKFQTLRSLTNPQADIASPTHHASTRATPAPGRAPTSSDNFVLPTRATPRSSRAGSAPRPALASPSTSANQPHSQSIRLALPDAPPAIPDAPSSASSTDSDLDSISTNSASASTDINPHHPRHHDRSHSKHKADSAWPPVAHNVHLHSRHHHQHQSLLAVSPNTGSHRSTSTFSASLQPQVSHGSHSSLSEEDTGEASSPHQSSHTPRHQHSADRQSPESPILPDRPSQPESRSGLQHSPTISTQTAESDDLSPFRGLININAGLPDDVGQLKQLVYELAVLHKREYERRQTAVTRKRALKHHCAELQQLWRNEHNQRLVLEDENARLHHMLRTLTLPGNRPADSDYSSLAFDKSEPTNNSHSTRRRASRICYHSIGAGACANREDEQDDIHQHRRPSGAPSRTASQFESEAESGPSLSNPRDPTTAPDLAAAREPGNRARAMSSPLHHATHRSPSPSSGPVATHRRGLGLFAGASKALVEEARLPARNSMPSLGTDTAPLSVEDFGGAGNSDPATFATRAYRSSMPDVATHTSLPIGDQTSVELPSPLATASEVLTPSPGPPEVPPPDAVNITFHSNAKDFLPSPITTVFSKSYSRDRAESAPEPRQVSVDATSMPSAADPSGCRRLQPSSKLALQQPAGTPIVVSPTSSDPLARFAQVRRAAHVQRVRASSVGPKYPAQRPALQSPLRAIAPTAVRRVSSVAEGKHSVPSTRASSTQASTAPSPASSPTLPHTKGNLPRRPISAPKTRSNTTKL